VQNSHKKNFQKLLVRLGEVVMGPGQKNFDSGQVSHLWFGVGKFSPETSNFSIFFLRIKKTSVGQVNKYPGQRQVGLLFTAGQKGQVRARLKY